VRFETLTSDQALNAIGRWARSRIAQPPWGSALGLARTLLALGTLATLLATPPQVMMSPLVGNPAPPDCAGVTAASAWCVVPGDPQVGRWLSVAILAAAASGWRPRYTAIPHWWVSISLLVSATVQDGGDQIAAVLTFLLIPVALTDPRTWHWQRADDRARGPLPRLVCLTFLTLAQLQVAALYLDAGIAKLGVPDWLNGTALFYIFHSVIFGAPGWLTPALTLLSRVPAAIPLMTWGAVALEITLGLALLLPRKVRPVLLTAGLLFHDTIAISMGLISFDVAMSASLLLYLLPIGHQVTWPAWPVRAAGRLRSRAPAPPPVRPATVTPASAWPERVPHGS
jgi:antimicrobial peptide system SdpB family protein